MRYIATFEIVEGTKFWTMGQVTGCLRAYHFFTLLLIGITWTPINCCVSFKEISIQDEVLTCDKFHVCSHYQVIQEAYLSCVMCGVIWKFGLFFQASFFSLISLDSPHPFPPLLLLSPLPWKFLFRSTPISPKLPPSVSPLAPYQGITMFERNPPKYKKKSNAP